ncbi:MAG: dihydrofolate reductase family protein [Patescibacteria group bacterium]|nr:dihydrofolate reductase family protein [Patescibacteria group bacterium]
MKTIIIMAESLDGSIAYDQNHSADWTSKEDKKFFVEETKKAGVIIFGHNTFKTFGSRPLPGRLNIILTRDHLGENIEGSLEYKTVENPKKLLKELKDRGYNKVFIGGGSAINSIFLDYKLIDELWINIEPKIFGTGMRIFSDKKKDINLILKSVKKVNQTVLLKYGVNYVSSNQK